VLIHYLAKGTLDPSVGSGGILVTHMSRSSEIHALVVDSADRIVISGVVGPSSRSTSALPLLLRHLIDGSLDSDLPGPDRPVLGRDLVRGRHAAAQRQASRGAFDQAAVRSGVAVASSPAPLDRRRRCTVRTTVAALKTRPSVVAAWLHTRR
jgi:hypothetical protein